MSDWESEICFDCSYCKSYSLDSCAVYEEDSDQEHLSVLVVFEKATVSKSKIALYVEVMRVTTLAHCVLDHPSPSVYHHHMLLLAAVVDFGSVLMVGLLAHHNVMMELVDELF